MFWGLARFNRLGSGISSRVGNEDNRRGIDPDRACGGSRGTEVSDARNFDYDPMVFDVGSMEEARSVALNPGSVHPPEELWWVETEYLMEIVDAYLPPRDATAL